MTDERGPLERLFAKDGVKSAPIFDDEDEHDDDGTLYYLKLMNASPDEAGPAMDQVERALDEGVRQAHIDAMLASADWRDQLVAAWALLLDREHRLAVDALWTAIDRGSWMTPQLVAAAGLMDPAFRDRVEHRAGGDWNVREPGGLSPLVRHTLTGPGDSRTRTAKFVTSAQAIARRVGADAAIPTEVRARAESDDPDDGGGIAERWYGRVESLLAERGVACMRS